MQPSGPSQRSMQRRSPGADPGPPPNVPVRSISPAVGTGAGSSLARSSASMNNRSGPNAGGVSASGNTSGSARRANTSSSSAVPLSQIEKSVTHLLVATKQLLETLTQWSRGQASDSQVSDVYVRLGYEFNMACRAFAAINVETADLGNVPESLRHILEATLSQEASVESLEKYLPRIRDIIINLLHGLKRKQQKLRQKQARDKDTGETSSGAAPNRATSTSTAGSVNSGLTTLLNEGIETGYRPDLQRQDSGMNISTSPSRRPPIQREQSRGSVASEQSSLSSNAMQNIPVLPPYANDESTMPSGSSTGDLSIDSFPPPPPPKASQQSAALAALQRGGDLERRASRRYSAYQISRHLGASANGVPMLPPQTTPIPNRGRGEVRESLRAVQTREAARPIRHTPTSSRTGGMDSSPVRVPSRVSEEPEVVAAPQPGTGGGRDSPVHTPDDMYPKTSATLNGPVPDVLPILDVPEADEPEQQKAPKAKLPAPIPVTTPEKQPESFMEENSPPPPKDLTLFLQYKSKVKKFVLPGGYSELSIGRLQLAFIEKFSWNTHHNGVDLPDIYIQDPVSGVRHELEDLADIKDRTVLVLNVEPLDEVKRHIDDGLGSLRQVISQVKQSMEDQGAAIQRVSERQLDAAKEMARLAAGPPPPMTPPADSPKAQGTLSTRKMNAGQLSELQSLRRDLAVLRQTYSNFQADIQSSMSSLRSKAGNIKVAAAKASMPDTDGDSGNAYVSKGRKQLNADSDRLVARVDDLQDLVEDLRKDVVHRGVRPLPRQLEAVTKDITDLTKELRKMEDYMRGEKPLWTKIWEKELEDVCQGRDELRLMEDLMVDLRDDLEKATETFALVEQATKEQMKDAGAAGGTGTGSGAVSALGRTFSKGLSNNAGVDPNAAKEGVLGEVRALQPNHEDRLEAIERAEKLRLKELASRRENPLKKELTDFVGEGKLKKAGGFEEVERARRAKDERIRREVWERQNGIVPSDPVGEGAEGEAEGTPV